MLAALWPRFRNAVVSEYCRRKALSSDRQGRRCAASPHQSSNKGSVCACRRCAPKTIYRSAATVHLASVTSDVQVFHHRCRCRGRWIFSLLRVPTLARLFRRRQVYGDAKRLRGMGLQPRRLQAGDRESARRRGAGGAKKRNDVSVRGALLGLLRGAGRRLFAATRHFVCARTRAPTLWKSDISNMNPIA